MHSRVTDGAYRALFEGIADGVLVADADGRYLDANPAVVALLGYSRDELLQMQVSDIVAATTEWSAVEYEAMKQSGHWWGEVELRRRDGSLVRVEARAVPVELPSGRVYVSILRDLTERRRFERDREQALAREQAARAAVEAAQWRLAFLAEASSVLGESLDHEATLRALARLVLPVLADYCVITIVDEGGTLNRVAVAHLDPAKEAILEESCRRLPVEQEPLHPLLEVLRTGRSAFFPDAPAQLWPTRSEGFRTLRALETRSAMWVPVRSRERSLGAMLLARSASDERYGPDDLALAEELARRAAVAVDNARLYRAAQRELAERRRAEAELRDSEERFRCLANATFEGVLVHDRGYHLLANEGFATTFGYEPGEVTGTSWTQFAAPESHEIIHQHISTGSQEPYEAVGIRKDGTRFDVEIRAKSAQYEGRPVRVTVVRDISQRKQLERRLRFLLDASRSVAGSLDYETTLRAVADLAVPTIADVCFIYVAREDRRVHRAAMAHADPAKTELLRELEDHYPLDMELDTPARRALQEGRSTLVDSVEDALLRSLTQDERHLEILHGLGFSSFVVAPLIARGRTLGALLCAVAASGRRYTADDLALAEELARRTALALDNARLYQEAQEAIRARDEFLTVASHELRTPVTSLRGYAQLLVRQLDREQPLDATRVRMALDVIERQSIKLAQLVSQLLDISRIQSARLSLEPKAVDLAALVRSAAAATQAATQDHTVTVDAPPELPAIADPLRLEQVLTNLLDNAVKYSPYGGRIQVELTVPVPGLAQLAVTDQGLGIPPGHRQQIFERFYQAHADDHRVGMGLGLYISRQIVELHGGEIRAEFPDAGGTRFVVTLPLTRTKD